MASSPRGGPPSDSRIALSEELATVMKIVGHVSALELRRFQRFRSFGPWPH